MPKIVDHDRRREEIAELTVGVIRSEGAGSATIRRIAAEGGFSIGMLGHYFKDKDDLVAFAFGWMAKRTFKDLDTVVADASPGLGRLRALASVPALIREEKARDALERAARLQALSEIAGTPGADAVPILAALQAALADRDVAVRLNALRGLVALLERPGIDRKSIAASLRSCTSDPNPLLAGAAREALARQPGNTTD